MSGLPDRLAREAVRQAWPDSEDVDGELIPIAFSGLYQPVSDAVRSALDEAAKVAREKACRVSCLHDDCRMAMMIVAAIEALK